MNHLGIQLQQAFARSSQGVRGELGLFRALMSALTSLGGHALAEEYHGSKSHVVFQAIRGAGRTKPRCELADLLLITYRAGGSQRFVRITWLQAKVTGRNLGCQLSGGAGHRTSFSANLEQWDLLGHRPLVQGATPRFQPPSDLLSAATLPSVGSFGVFYPCGRGFDMAYFSADCLQPLRNNPGRSGTLGFIGSSATRVYGALVEATSACCLRTFGDAIQRGHVGSPVLPLLAAGGAPAAAARRNWLGSLLRGLADERPNSILARELQELLEFQRGDGDPVGSPARATVLLRYQSDEEPDN